MKNELNTINIVYYFTKHWKIVGQKSNPWSKLQGLLYNQTARRDLGR